MRLSRNYSLKKTSLLTGFLASFANSANFQSHDADLETALLDHFFL
jgi:hypothetical protein